MALEDLVERAGELKRQLVEYSQRPRYDRAFREMVADHGGSAEVRDEDRLMLLWDSFLLEHRLRNGRTVVEQFVEARPDLSPQDRQLLLGWRDVVTGVFEVQRRDGPALILDNLVDDLTYRAWPTAGPSALRGMPRRSFLLARLVSVGNEWTFSGPVSVLRPAERAIAFRLALDMSLQAPEAVFRNPERLARAWELQRAERQRFIRFFGSDLVVVPGDQAQQRLDEFSAFSREEIMRQNAEAARQASGIPVARMELSAELVESGTIAFLFDEEDGLGFYTEFGLLEEAFADPDLVRHCRYQHQVRSCLDDESVPPMVLRRLADRDPDKAGAVFRRLLKRPRFDWSRDGEELLRSAKPEYYSKPHLPQITPVGDRLTAYAGRQ